jgi:hypothetical protein
MIRTSLEGELCRALGNAWYEAGYRSIRSKWAAPSLADTIRSLSNSGLTTERAEAVLAALALGASFEQALEMLDFEQALKLLGVRE